MILLIFLLMANCQDILEIFNCPNLDSYFSTIPKHNNFTVLHTNIRSLTKNYSQLTYHISKHQNKIDLIVLTEVNISESLSCMFNIKGYTMHTKLRKSRKGGGIIIYIRQNLTFTKVTHHTLHSECIIGNITTSQHFSIFLCALYRPPGNSKHLFLRTELPQILSKHCPTGNFILIGDLNLDLKEESMTTDRYVNLLSERGLQCAISDYTTVEMLKGSVTKSCIDHIFIRYCTGDVHSAALGTVLADHRMTVATLTGVRPVQDVLKKISLINKTVLYDKLNKIDWDRTEVMQCPNQIYNFIRTNFDDAYNSATFSKVVSSSSKRNNLKWFSIKLKNRCEKTDEHYIKWLKDPTNRLLRLEYNAKRNKCHKLIGKARNKHILDTIQENKNDPRKTWSIINDLTGKINKTVEDIILQAFKKSMSSEKLIAKNFSDEFKKSVNNIMP